MGNMARGRVLCWYRRRGSCRKCWKKNKHEKVVGDSHLGGAGLWDRDLSGQGPGDADDGWGSFYDLCHAVWARVGVGDPCGTDWGMVKALAGAEWAGARRLVYDRGGGVGDAGGIRVVVGTEGHIGYSNT